MSGSIPSQSKKRRYSKACARCRKRKIRCDFQFPTCGACSTTDATCVGFDSIHGTDKPRSTVSHLEEEVARLEIELQRIKSQNNGVSVSESANAAVERLTTSLAVAIVEPGGISQKPGRFFALNTPFFLSASPVPYLSSQPSRLLKTGKGDELPPSPITISLIPRQVVDTMLKHYCEIYRPQYPAIEESDLYDSCERVYNNHDPSDFDVFCVHISLAISTSTLMYKDEVRATTAACGFWATAVAHLGQVGLANAWERLQALQLLTHYGFLNPKDVDIGRCAAAASRLCSQLGLHQELPHSAKIKLDYSTLNTKMRLLWHSYSMDCAFNTISCRPFLWPPSISPAKFPDCYLQPSPTLHVWTLRQIESEVTLTLYYPSLAPVEILTDTSLKEWMMRVHERLNKWHQVVHQSMNLTEKLEFHELHYQVQLLRLNRPSPRCPVPPMEMCKKALKASIDLIKEFSIIDRLGKLFYLWHAAYYLVESGVCLLASVLTGMECPDPTLTHLQGEDIGILVRYIKTFPFLLRKISRRWPNISCHASALDVISLSVLEKVQSRAAGAMPSSSDLNSLKGKLNYYSRFSPFPTSTKKPPGEVDIETRENELIPVQEDNSVPMNFQNSTNLMSINPGFVDTQLPTEYNFPIIPDLYGIDGGDALSWDFAGMNSEEIFAALLDGGENDLSQNPQSSLFDGSEILPGVD